MEAIRIGRVSAVDAKKGMVNVTYEDNEDEATDYLPYLTFASEYKMPKVKDMVMVAHLSNSSGTVSAVVIGGFWNKANVPQVDDGTVWKKFLSDEAYMEFDGTTMRICAPKILLTCSNGTFDVNAFLKGSG